MTPYIYLLLMAFLASSVSTFILVRALVRYKMRQVEREEGPLSHKKKRGTPTMGGLAFILVAAAFAALMVDLKYLPVVFLFLGYSLVGLLDDLVKVYKSRNLGLTFWQKIISQTALSAVFVLYLLLFANHWQNAGIFSVLGPVFYFLFSVFLIVGCANAANLTDGLDGLLSGVSILSFISFAFIASKLGFFGGAAFCVIFAGSILGFLLFNFPKAKIFMGDTASLAIGAAISGFAVILGRELALAIVCGVFLIEALSVIIQVGSFKFFGKRVFKMAPLHHHFELLGLSELKVVLLFWAAQAVLSLIGALIL